MLGGYSLLTSSDDETDAVYKSLLLSLVNGSEKETYGRNSYDAVLRATLNGTSAFWKALTSS